MLKDKLIYELSGDVSYHENTDVIQNTDRDNIERLNNRKPEIESIIKSEIANLLNKIGIDASVTVDIYFEKGSILITGLVALDYAGKISGGIAMVEYISRFIKWAIRKAINTPSFNQSSATVNINAVPITNFSEAPVNENVKEESAGLLFGLKQSSIILAITLLNVALFLGGTIYTGFQVSSIQERYNLANEKITNAENKFNEASRTLQHSEIAFQSKLSVFDTISRSLNGKKMEVENLLTTNKTDIGKSISQINSQINSYSNSLRDARDKIDATKIEAVKLEGQLKELTAANKRLGFDDFLHISSYGVIFYALIINAIVLVTFVKTLKKK